MYVIGNSSGIYVYIYIQIYTHKPTKHARGGRRQTAPRNMRFWNSQLHESSDSGLSDDSSRHGRDPKAIKQGISA